MYTIILCIHIYAYIILIKYWTQMMSSIAYIYLGDKRATPKMAPTLQYICICNKHRVLANNNTNKYYMYKLIKFWSPNNYILHSWL